jgi:hypothetical protein
VIPRLFVLLLLFVAPYAFAQQYRLGISQDSIFEILGKPDSISESGAFFHLTIEGRSTSISIYSDTNYSVVYYDVRTRFIDSIAQQQKYRSLESEVGRLWPNRLEINGGSYAVFLSSDSLREISIIGNDIVDIRYLRAAFNTNYASGLVESDDYFEVANSAMPLDSESVVVLNSWRAYLAEESYRPSKYQYWSRYDRFLADYSQFAYNISFSTDYYAKVTGVVKDPVEGFYLLSTIYYPIDTTGAGYRNTIPISKQVTYMIKEDGAWKATSPLPYLTRNWKERSVGNVVYHYPPQHVFNEGSAREAQHYLDSITALFSVKKHNRIDYYYCLPGHNVNSLFGVNDRSITTYAQTIARRNLIFSKDSSECYKHELVHAALDRPDTLDFISEGIACFMSGDTELVIGHIKYSNQFLNQNPDFSFHNLKHGWLADSIESLTYATGALFFDKVYSVGGLKAVVDFYNMSVNEDGFFKATQKYLHINRKDIDHYWKSEIAKFVKEHETDSETSRTRDEE